MRLPDVNLLLYAVNRRSPRHARAKAWLERRLSGTEPMAFTWSTVNGFVRLTTKAVAFPVPLSQAQAFDVVEGWLARPNAVIVDPTDRHLGLMRQLLEPLGVAGNLVTDAHLAALAIEHGAILESSDHDFGRFAGLRWEDPLRGGGRIKET
jgi:toxin-antitoxin system PIN domain toxin